MSNPVIALKELHGKFPLTEEQQSNAEELVRQCTSQELAAMGLSAPMRPAVPKMLDKLPMRPRLAAVQKVITSIEYNHSPGYFYNISKDRPFCRIMDTAREVMREALPIKCIEAVFLGALLTAGWEGLQRLPLGFKSKVNGETYRHIVLLVHHVPTQKWGALGISRRDELMYKDLVFDSLSDLVLDFKAGYEKWWHKLQKARIGLPFEHDVYSNADVCWRYCTVSPAKYSWAACAMTLDKFAEDYKQISAKFKVLGYAPPRAAAHGNSADNQRSSSGRSPEAVVPSLTAVRMAQSTSPTKRRPQPQPQDPRSGGTNSPSHRKPPHSNRQQQFGRLQQQPDDKEQQQGHSAPQSDRKARQLEGKTQSVGNRSRQQQQQQQNKPNQAGSMATAASIAPALQPVSHQGADQGLPGGLQPTEEKSSGCQQSSSGSDFQQSGLAESGGDERGLAAQGSTAAACESTQPDLVATACTDDSESDDPSDGEYGDGS